MQTWVALLRGVNVGGNNKVPMGKLRTALSGQPGFGEARSYIASGNLVFSATGTAAGLAARIEALILAEFDVSAATLVLSAADLRGALTSRPVDPEAGNLMHGFFPFGPVSMDWAAYEALKVASETVTMGDGVVWLHTPQGFGKSKLAEKFGKVIKGAAVTGRNLNTIRTLVEMLDNIA